MTRNDRGWVGKFPVSGNIPTEAAAAHDRPHLLARLTVSMAGLLVAGCLVLGVGLLVLMIVVPRTGGTGFDYATGPGWPRTIAHLAVGALGEVALQVARRRIPPVRVTVEVAVAVPAIVGVLLVLALSWWR